MAAKTCLQCGVEIKLGTLCPAHAAALAQCADITAEQVRPAPVDAPRGCLVDQWGRAHLIDASVSLGRSPEQAAFAILHPSVSALHAHVEVAADRGRVHDRGSLNGTFVNGERVRSGVLFDGDVLKVGDVCFLFSTTLLATEANPGGTGSTLPSKASDIALQVVLTHGRGELELVQRIAGGIARIGEESLELARLEFSLLQALVERKQLFGDPELCFVSSSELADVLDFKSRDADSDNVRELVRRVRRKLKAAGVQDLIESRQGVGYRVAWDIKPPASR